MDSFVVSALQDAGGYAISRQNNLELHVGCHAYGAEGRSEGSRSVGRSV